MTDTERLATDRAYWDEVAPEGAEAFINEEFTMWLGSIEFSFDDGEWVKECISWPLSKYVMAKNFTVIIRPDAPEEWDGTGLPPVGVECECLFNDGWVKVLVLSVNGYEAWVRRPRGSHIVSEGLGNEFRPIRTLEQREQEALALSIQNAMECVTRRKLHDEDSFAVANILTVAATARQTTSDPLAHQSPSYTLPKAASRYRQTFPSEANTLMRGLGWDCSGWRSFI